MYQNWTKHSTAHRIYICMWSNILWIPDIKYTWCLWLFCWPETAGTFQHIKTSLSFPIGKWITSLPEVIKHVWLCQHFTNTIFSFVKTITSACLRNLTTHFTCKLQIFYPSAKQLIEASQHFISRCLNGSSSSYVTLWKQWRHLIILWLQREHIES